MVTLTTMMEDVHRLKKKKLYFTKANTDNTTVDLQPQYSAISQQEQPVTQGQIDYIGLSMNLPANARGTGGAGSIPGWERSPGERNGNPLQYSCWENPRDRGAWWAAVHGASKSQTQLSN